MDGPDWTIRIICWDVYAKAQLGLDLWLLAVMVMVILMIIVMTYGSDGDGDYDYCSNANNIDAGDNHIIIIIFFREGRDATTTIIFGVFN